MQSGLIMLSRFHTFTTAPFLTHVVFHFAYVFHVAVEHAAAALREMSLGKSFANQGFFDIARHLSICLHFR